MLSNKTEAVVRGWSLKMYSQKFRKIHRKTPVCSCRPEPASLLKKSLWHRSFPVYFAEFPRTPFFTEHLRWLLLIRWQSLQYSSQFMKVTHDSSWFTVSNLCRIYIKTRSILNLSKDLENKNLAHRNIYQERWRYFFHYYLQW